MRGYPVFKGQPKPERFRKAFVKREKARRRANNVRGIEKLERLKATARMFGYESP